jgi:ribonuclease Y
LRKRIKIYCKLKIEFKQKEGTLNQQIEQNKRKQSELDTLQANLTSQLEVIDRKKEEIDKAHVKQVQALEKIAGLSADDAKKQLVEALKAESKTEAMQFIKETMDEAKVNCQQGSKENCDSNHPTCSYRACD